MRTASHILLLVILALLTSCSTKKNTAGARWFHSMTARFNTLYNGETAYREALEAQQKGHKDDYTQTLPMYIAQRKATAAMGKGQLETAITKAEKAIKLHSIKKKPERKGNKSLTPKEKAFRARREFNPYLRHAWMMMGQAQFQKGDFIEAASTFHYVARLYATQPEVSCVAKAWLARCYVAMEWPYDAEDILSKMSRDSITARGLREQDNSYAAYYVATQQADKAVPYLQKTIKATRNRLQRARLNFLLAQTLRQTGDEREAYRALGRVVKSNPPYELAFAARIMQSEVMSADNYKGMVKRLTRMAKSDKNKDYLDQVYYALGNIHLAAGDTLHAIYAWEKGNEESTGAGPAKAVLLLRLSDIYYEQEKYIDAARTYALCVAALDKERDEYKEAERRSKVLTELATPLGDVKLQDSLQALAKLPEKEYLAAIDRVIDALKKKEKEEAKKAAANGGTAQGGQPGQAATAKKPTSMAQNAGQKGAWYFYNPQTVMQGRQQFQQKWGQRPNEDNWRRANKSVPKTTDEGEGYNYDEEESDTTATDAISEEEQARLDSIANDPHHREYYLRQIPFTEEQLAASHETLKQGLYNAGLIEGDKLGNCPLSARTLERLLQDYPDFDQKANTYYHLFLVYGRMGNEERTAHYRDLLINEYPEDPLAVLLANPNYELIARDGRHQEDSLYNATYEAYRASRYGEVTDNFKYHTDNFPEGTHRGKMLFIDAMTQLYTDHYDLFLKELKEVVEKYSKDEVNAMAAYIVKGLDAGRTVSGDKYDAQSIWGRRTAGGEADTTQAEAKLSADLFGGYIFLLAYPSKSVNERQLLYELARYNFTSFSVRNFDIELQEDRGLTMMVVKGFEGYNEVHAYAQQLYADAHMRTVVDSLRSYLISEENFRLLGHGVSFDDYELFYDRTLKPLPTPPALLDDDKPIINEDDYNADDYPQPEEAPQEEATPEDEDDLPFGF